MELNTGFNDLLGYPLSLHKIQVNSFGLSAEAVEFVHRTSKPTITSFLT